jgi:NADH-quinone oxidoreductase subunit C
MLEQLKKINELSNIKDKKLFFEGDFLKQDVVKLLRELKNNEAYCFDQLIDITAVDHPSKEKRFELIYILLSMKKNKRIILRTSIKENENLDSIFNVFKSSNWYERECYDLFGINFNNHPDLRRIMTDYNFEGHPLRKDFPLTGHTEVRYDDVEKKVVYEPVKLSQEYRDFDYTSPWEGMSRGIDDLSEEDKV